MYMPKIHQIFGVKRFLNEERKKLVLFEKISDRYFLSLFLEKVCLHKNLLDFTLDLFCSTVRPKCSIKIKEKLNSIWDFKFGNFSVDSFVILQDLVLNYFRTTILEISLRKFSFWNVVRFVYFCFDHITKLWLFTGHD